MVLKILPGAAILSALATGQTTPLSCNASFAPANFIVRGEGHTEQVADLSLQCTGGTPTPSGQPIPTVSLQVTLNANVTSRLVSANVTEAVLMIDDPYPSRAVAVPNNGDVPAYSPMPILCPIGSTCTEVGGSAAANPWETPTDPYSNQPNIFFGTLTSANTIQWSNIPLDPPGDGGTRYLRIANVRVDAAQTGAPGFPSMAVQFTASPSITVSPSTLQIASIGQGLRGSGDSGFATVPGPVIAACTNHNGVLLGGVGEPAFDFNVRLNEGFDSSLRPRNIAVSADGNSVPPLASQNVPGYAYYTETGIYSPSFFSATPSVGYADFGSRIQVFINDIAAGSGVHFFVPVTVEFPFIAQQPPPPLAPGLHSPTLRLVRTDEFGMSGPGFTPINATTSIAGVPVAEMTYSSGFAYATYEVLTSDPISGANGTIVIPVALAFGSNSINDEPTASATLAPAGGPVASIATADASAPIPRFAQNTATWNPYIAYPCAMTAPANPNPANGAASVLFNTNLQWQPVPGAGSYDVYLGYAGFWGNPIQAPMKVASEVTRTSYSPAILAGSTEYYWRVVANFPSGSAPSPLWSFTTVAAALTANVTHFGNFNPGQQTAAVQIIVSNGAGAGATNGPVSVSEELPQGLTAVSISGSGWTCPTPTSCLRSDILAPGASYPPITVIVNVASDAPSKVSNEVLVQWFSGDGGEPSATSSDITNILPPPTITTALGFFPLTPCRMVDTRTSQRQPGPLGPPSLTASTRDFPLLSSNCNIPNSAQAYSINATVVPSGSVPYLSAWPTGNPYPNVSTLNSPDGATLANAAILSAGTNGALTVLSGGPTDLILDINGYLAPPNGSELAFFPVTPCRIADTRTSQNKTGPFGPPALVSGATRDFPIAESCGIPDNAAAYSLNMTAVPNGPLQYLSTWPAGQAYPNVSTLNSPDGSIIANAAIVPAGTNGSITVLAGGNTDLIIDTNGYFAKPTVASPGLHYYALASPCRVADTRSSQGMQGDFGPPSLIANATRDFPILNSACNVPTEAQAYALNITVVPQGPLGYLSLWPAGQPYPGSSTLNAPKGLYLANAAIVPAGTNGAITVLPSNATDLIIDINGYFAP